MKVEVWTDMLCPWCYLGKRRLERALERFEHNADVEIVWRSYELDARAPRRYEGTLNDLLVRKYGMSQAQADAAHARLAALGAEDGLDYHFERARPGNSLDAHRLVHLAAERGLGGAMQERLMRAYFTEGTALGDRDALVQCAADVGLEPDAAKAMLESDAFIEDVRADERRASSLGLRGVPAFLVDETFVVSGAESVDTLLSMLNRAWDAEHASA